MKITFVGSGRDVKKRLAMLLKLPNLNICESPFQILLTMTCNRGLFSKSLIIFKIGAFDQDEK